MKARRVIISGGGTAGHIYPALAVGRTLKERDPALLLTYVGTSRELEKNIMKRHRVDFIPLKIEGLKRRGLKTLRALFLLPFSFIKSLAVLRRVKPDLVIGVGGYSSGPIVLLAAWMKIPTLILEQNSCPGLTNRLLRRWVEKAAVSFEVSLPLFKGKAVFTGNPVREEFYRLTPKPRNLKLAILIFGGSQGSHFLNTAATAALPLLKEQKEKLRIFHQTGEKDIEWVKESYRESGFQDVTVSPYFTDMARCFEQADLIISRAGATTIAELIAARKASLLVPFSQAADNHQMFNAREVEKIGGAEILLEDEFSPETLAGKIGFFLEQREKISEMEKNLGRMKTENVAGKIADICFELMEKRKRKK